MQSNGSRWTALTAAYLATLITADAARGQAFQNLDFEASILESDGGRPFARAPGWNFSGEGDPFSTGDVVYLGLHLGLIPLQRMATDLVEVSRTPPPPIQGHFSLFMGPAPHEDTMALFPWMEQTGQVPADARSIRLAGDIDPFLIRSSDPSRSGWQLMLGGIEIPLIELPNGVISGDVSAHAGTLTALRIAIDASYYLELPPPGGQLRTNFMFDALRFSPLHYTVVPEPGSSALAFISLAAYGIRSRHRRSSSVG
jgi:hypothetical protein